MLQILLLKCKMFTLELQHIDINASSSVSTVKLGKTKAITHLTFDLHVRKSLFRPPFHVTQQERLEIQTCSVTKR